jgi:hypothetical protein
MPEPRQRYHQVVQVVQQLEFVGRLSIAGVKRDGAADHCGGGEKNATTGLRGVLQKLVMASRRT